MDLLVIRHGAARDRGEFAQTGLSDDLRPLTAEGADEMRRVARGLRTQVKSIDFLATSPLVRAVQTAEIVAEAFGIEVSETTTSLTPDAQLEEFEKWCAGVGPKKVVAVVGHEPHLSTLVTWLLSGERESRVRLRKAGAALLEFESDVRRDSGTLGWLVTPRQLAANAEST
jgi:phosphohistidine phosphatase